MIPLGQKNTLAEYMILFGADNHPPMLDKDLYDSWKSRMELYMQNREHERMIIELVENGPLIWPTIEENGVTRTKKYVELSAAKKIQVDCDMKERECKLYDAFDKFTHIKGESLHKYYLRFTQLINDMNIYNMKMEQFQVNTKFLNSLPPEWSKFVTDVKLVKDLHTTNFDQLHAYLEQHELHANEVHLLHKRNKDPLAFVANQQMTPSHFKHLSVFIQQSSDSTTVFTISIWINSSQSTLLINLSITTLIQSFINSTIISISVSNESSNLFILQIAYQSPQASTQPMTKSPLVDSVFDVLVFSPKDDPIAYLNKEMAFQIVVASLRFPSTKNQLRTSFNLRNQATIQDDKVTVQQVHGRQGEGHMARQCTQPKRPRNATWYKEKAMLAEAQEARQILDEEQLVFFADLGVPDGQAIQTIIPNNAAFQTEDLDTYDFDYDDISMQKITLANAVPPKKTTSHSVETQKPKLKVYNMKPKNVKNIGSSKKSKIVESKNANHSEPNHTWGSKATYIPSSSFLVMTGKTKKSSHQPKAEDTNQDKLYLLHMDLCGLMRVASINEKRGHHQMHQNIQVRLNAIVHNVRTDNGTEFVNQTLRKFYENVGISHQTSVARTPQQNDVVERRNRTLIEAAHTISRPELHSMTPATSSLGLTPNTVSQQPCIPPNRDDWDHLFQPMFDAYFTPQSIDFSPVPVIAAPRAIDLADSPVSTSIDHDAVTPPFLPYSSGS
uniref:Integrase catalytic domain-containing protein n=1 Tax=Tanacetum cinerariifolium TaxID=118510 RepID=A0A699GZ29_TANCI|nr:hypothetical protein [Tanacetum cinerariifolium]